nr:hypothetical protein [Tanacetum cinerariifolium]
MVFNHHIALMKSWLVQKQTALGKDKSNPLMADNLPKIVWYSTQHITLMKSWLVQKQTALGKDKSNPLMADNLPKIVCFGTLLSSSRLITSLGVDCLPNEEIFAELARMGYEKLSTKLTFYKAFFSSQWKFLIHTILQSMSAKRTSWNEFSSAMTSAVICLSTGVETPLFEGMLVAGVIEEEGAAEEQVPDVVVDDAAAHEADTTVQGDDTQPQPQPQAQQQAADFLMSLLQEALDACAALTRRVEHLEIDTSEDTMMEDASHQGRMIDDKEEEKKEEEVKDDQVQGRQAKIYKIDMDHASKVLSMQEDNPAEVQEIVDVVTTAKLITKVVTAASETVTAASTTIFAAEPQVPTAAITTAAPVKVAAASTRRRKGVVIRDPKEESTIIIPADTKSKDKGKGIMDVAIEHVKQKAEEDPFVQRYQIGLLQGDVL